MIQKRECYQLGIFWNTFPCLLATWFAALPVVPWGVLRGEILAGWERHEET